MKANPDDVFKQRNGLPRLREFADIIEKTKKILMDRTGYELQAAARRNLPEKSRADNLRLIRAAVGKKINTASDTGFDIVPKE